MTKDRAGDEEGGEPTAGAASPRVEVRRHPERARYDRGTIHAILDGALVCHLGVIVDGEPLVLPTGFGRVGETLYLHGAAANRSLAAALEGVCVSVTHLDGLVLARSASGHSMNYRSVVVRDARARSPTPRSAGPGCARWWSTPSPDGGRRSASPAPRRWRPPR